MASASSRVEHPTTKLSRWGAPLSIGKWTSTTKASSTYLGIPAICVGSHAFSSRELCHDQTNPLPRLGSKPALLGRTLRSDLKETAQLLVNAAPWRRRGHDLPRPSGGHGFLDQSTLFAGALRSFPANRKCIEPPSIQDNGIKFIHVPPTQLKLRITEDRSAAYKGLSVMDVLLIASRGPLVRHCKRRCARTRSERGGMVFSLDTFVAVAWPGRPVA